MATNKKGGNKDNGLGVAVGLGAVAAAVGAYFMYGSKKAAKNRKAVKSWMFKAKADVLEALENTQDMTKKEYEKLIDTVGTSYANIQSATKTDLAGFKKEMKEHWLEIAKTAAPKKAPAKKKPAKKAAPKKAPAKKAAKKE
ncbi:MAG: hypothetical protein H6779_04985 [Candidatus Nomurabacteria bacterium]|nr:hypothetical protein [Candidatus Nomurabacteria bacterium]USN87723.1 MAG: hypothetical protein H6779_04985 [Candidatus Nomurabacteria bacterium]